MGFISTYNQLMLLAYDELNPEEAATLRGKIDQDPTIHAEWEKIQKTMQDLDDMNLSPPEKSLRIVEEESRDLAVA